MVWKVWDKVGRLAACVALIAPSTWAQPAAGNLGNDFPYAQSLGPLDLPRPNGAGPFDRFSYFPFYHLSFRLNPGVPGFDEAFLKFSTSSPQSYGTVQIREAHGNAVQVRWYDAAENEIPNCTNQCTLRPGLYYLRLTPAQGHLPQGYSITLDLHALPADTFAYGSANPNAPTAIGSALSPGDSGTFSGALYGVLERGQPINGVLTLPATYNYVTDHRTQYFSITTAGQPLKVNVSGPVESSLVYLLYPTATWAPVPFDGVVQNYGRSLLIELTTDVSNGKISNGQMADFFEPFTISFQSLQAGQASVPNGPPPAQGGAYTGPVYCVLPPSQQQNCPPGTIH